MASFRTEGQLVGAANNARDLTNLVTAYLNLWRDHANDLNGVSVPSENYSLVFLPPQEKGVSFKLVATLTRTWDEPTYYDVDSDYFVESYSGEANRSGSVMRSEEYTHEKAMLIPYSCLLRSAAEMEADIKAAAIRIRAAKAEEQRKREIADLESRITELKSKEAP